MSAPWDEFTEIHYGILKSVEQLEHPLLRRLHSDWCAAAAAEGCMDGLPDHTFIDPLKLDYLLGWLLVVGVERPAPDKLRFKLRLIGTEIVEHRERDRTGRWVDEVEDQVLATQGPKICRLVVEARRPVRAEAVHRIDDKNYPVEHLLLPLIDDGGTIDRLLIAQIYPRDTPRVAYAHA
ncbi:MAG: PAS domain-containing protein [Ferrovibrio sp.]|uniref:PAS domain-containing protein n=1 Tax=Ferrovibrio sp. TaxID=1917215 RepID=UPI00391ACB91